ncbi:hypothetical protein PH210_18395 [Paenibacillus sp. BSR1-1]|uniref:hypothetical protein n=1 Tax=Paenibacillus sp. BSR1-1 TaxID=3020845 RepID=UPI0025B1EA86|nr:hypothetical protein [Paenibacillus sp. BSR1-1]MDN3018150.1 hypothetical protein [Paenibacillus sp. BSR1-1]
MRNLSDKDVLEMLSNFPKHELTTEQRTDLLMVIGEATTRKHRKPFNFQRIAALASVFVLVLLAPLLYFTDKKDSSSQITGSGRTKTVQQGEYFALKDTDGSPLYADSNFGVPNKVSLLAPQEWLAKDRRGLSKIAIYLWGDYEKDFANKPLKIDAIHVKTGVKEHLATTVISGGMYGADGHAMTGFKSLDLPGKWNLEFTAGNKKIGEFSIYVKEPYVIVGNSTLMISQEDLFAGFYEDVFIEVEGDDLPPEITLEVFSLENGEASEFTFKDKKDYTTTDGKKMSMYQGDFHLKKSGKYRFTILQKSEAVEVRKPLSN